MTTNTEGRARAADGAGRTNGPDPAASDPATQRRDIELALLRAEEERVAAVAAAERGARQLINGLNRAFDSAATERNCFAWLGRPAPLAISVPALADRLGQRLAAVMAGFAAQPGRLGPVTWYGTWRSPADRWADEETAEMGEGLRGIGGQRQ